MNAACRVAAATFIIILSVAGIIFTPSRNLFVCGVAAVAGCTVIEIGRRVQRNERWWIAYIAMLPWIAIVIVPWTYFAIQGNWTILRRVIDIELPNSWRIHLLAVVGLSLGTVAGLALRRGSSVSATGDSRAARLRVGRLHVILTALIVVYLVSFILARRPLAALWKLSGTVVYGSKVDGGTGLLFLDLSLVTATVTLLVYCSGRRSVRRRPTGSEIGWLAVYAVLALGSGIRGRVFLLLIGWAIVQFAPELRAKATTRPRRLTRLVAGVLAVLVLVPAAAFLADQRVRVNAAESSALRRTVETTEVIGAAEVLIGGNVEVGSLDGVSYLELPSLFVPAAIVGGEKEGPSADELMRHHLARSAGYSAPLWFEAALNFGLSGAFGFMFAYAFGCVALIRRLRRSSGQCAVAVGALGPVWLLVSYSSLNRLTLFQALVGIGASLLGVSLGSRTVVWSGVRTVGSVGRGKGCPRPSDMPYLESASVRPRAD